MTIKEFNNFKVGDILNLVDYDESNIYKVTIISINNETINFDNNESFINIWNTHKIFIKSGITINMFKSTLIKGV